MNREIINPDFWLEKNQANALAKMNDPLERFMALRAMYWASISEDVHFGFVDSNVPFSEISEAITSDVASFIVLAETDIILITEEAA